MIPSLRADFNSRFTPEKYQTLLTTLEQRCGTPVKFRVSETPCFFPFDLLGEMSHAGEELIRQLVDSRDYHARSEASIPPEFNVPREDSHPTFIQVDFGLDTPFLHEELRLTSELESRVRANVQVLVDYISRVEKNVGAETRLLWSESDENLAQKLISRLQRVQ